MNLVQATVAAADSPGMVIAVVDRVGDVLAVYGSMSARQALSSGNFGNPVPTDELAVSVGRTGAFFSNDQAPLSSRTVRFISGIHFPPGVDFTANAALYGIENTNRGCTLSTNFNPGKNVPPSAMINGAVPGLGIITGKPDVNDSVQYPNAVNPGGVPVFRNGGSGELLGAIGVAGVPSDVAEYAAFAGAATAAGFSPVPVPLPLPGVVFIDGIALPFVNQQTPPSGVTPGTFDATLYQTYKSAIPAPEGDLVGPMQAQDGLVGGLTKADVMLMITNAVSTANQTRAMIRLPLGQRAKMVIAVSDLDGNIIGLNRMHDATIFSIDVAATKARNVVYFTGPSRTSADLNGVPLNTAVTNRTISFGAQPFFPPGIDGSAPGPFFNVYTNDVANPCTQGFQPPNSNQSGIVFFPGSVPLYKNGILVGGLGVSGDGVEQDDFVTAGGADGASAPDALQCLLTGVGSQCFEAAPAIRADQVSVTSNNGVPVRLPYLKFPRDPTF
jgi:uncharacterized protein GlcG (DUF336 family)